MPRRRFGVALLLPEPVRTEVFALRRALGAPSLFTQPPHLTLVPPVNVREDDVPRALRVLRDAAGIVRRPLTFDLGPIAAFAPVTPVVYLAITGEDLPELCALRDAVFVPPLFRDVTYDYVPHVTLHEDLGETGIQHAMSALQHFVVRARFDSIVLLQQSENDRVWRSFADVFLGPPIVRGRGGIELYLRWCREPAPDVRELLTTQTDWRSGSAAVTLEARDRDQQLLGARNSTQVAVVDAHLGEGIEERLLAEPEPVDGVVF